MCVSSIILFIYIHRCHKLLNAAVSTYKVLSEVAVAIVVASPVRRNINSKNLF